ncbi:ATP-binding response regulator [Desulfonema magnum]|nr:hybrid sensor histidine kinase/response regulator [Desulfonema magnum]
MINNKILLVDDEEGIRKVLSIVIADIGYEVHTAENAKEALEIFRKESPSIVLTDIKMPGMDGITLLRKIKNENPETEVIMITGHGDMELAVKSLKYEATDFITKPIDDTILEVSLKRSCERILTRQKLKEYTESLEALVREKAAIQDRLSSLGLMVSSISHGIKGLLTGLDGGIYLLDSGLIKKKDDQINEGLGIIKVMTERIKKMILDILFYAKERKSEWEETDVTDFANEVADVVEKKMQDHHIEFLRDFDSESGVFEADVSALRSALINILENATDACAEDKSESSKKIIFSAKKEGNSIRFGIQDDGIGMDEEKREKIFTLFFSSKKEKGTGLGLFIANKIITRHGGTIKVDSAPGQGTFFHIKLPKKIPQQLKIPSSMKS